MPIKLPSHLHRNRFGVYGFRIVIPRDLRLSFPQREFRLSLRTCDKRIAKQHAVRISSVTHDYFSRIRTASTVEEAAFIAREFSASLSNISFDEKTNALRSIVAANDGPAATPLREIVRLRDKISEINEKKFALAKCVIAQLQDKEDEEVDSVFCDIYDELTSLTAEAYAASLEIQSQELKAQEIMANLVRNSELAAQNETHQEEIGKLSDFAAEIAAKAAAKAVSSAHESSGHQTVVSKESEPLTAIVEGYCANQRSEGAWTEKTEAENRAIFALWIRIVDDQPIKGYGFEQHREYKAKLQRLPSNLNKSPRYREKTIDEILALGDPPAAPNTINKNLSRVSALFEWAIKYGYSNLNPARGMTIANPKRANEERQAFTDDDLSKLFGTIEYQEGRHKHPYQYWVPLIALYSGARLNEICQLHLGDITEQDGVQIFRITDEGGNKRLKTKAARRSIPIHPELLRLGLLNYAAELREQGHERLFPELKEGRDGYGKAATKWFAAYSTRCGVDAPGKVFHSFRHTFIDGLKQADVPKGKIAALVGHEDDSMTFGRYGKDYKPDLLNEAICHIRGNLTEHLNSISILNDLNRAKTLS